MPSQQLPIAYINMPGMGAETHCRRLCFHSIAPSVPKTMMRNLASIVRSCLSAKLHMLELDRPFGDIVGMSVWSTYIIPVGLVSGGRRPLLLNANRFDLHCELGGAPSLLVFLLLLAAAAASLLRLGLSFSITRSRCGSLRRCLGNLLRYRHVFHLHVLT